jgi:hypothetical protein
MVTMEVVGGFGLDQMLKDIEDLGGPTAAQTLRKSAGLMGRVCVDRTQPVVDQTGGAISANSETFSGTSPEAKKMGQAAVARDVGRVYASIATVCGEIRRSHGSKASKAFYAMMQNSEFDKADKMLQSLGVQSARRAGAWDGGARHRQLRTNRGRINRGTKPTVTPLAESVAVYIKRMKDHVGYTKSGWITAARQIPGAKGVTRGVPVWVTKHAGPGTGIDATRSPDPSITLTNRVPWIATNFGGRQQGMALKGFDKILLKSLQVKAQHLRQKHQHLLAA